MVVGRSRGSRGCSASRPRRPASPGVAQVRPAGRVVCVLTGHGLKDPGRGRAAVSGVRTRAPATTANLGPGLRLRRGRARPLERGRGDRGRRRAARPGAHRHPRVRPGRLAGGARRSSGPTAIPRARGLGSSAATIALGMVAAMKWTGQELDARGSARARRAARGPLRQPRRLPRRRRLPDLGRPDRADRRHAPAHAGRGDPGREGADGRGAHRASGGGAARRRGVQRRARGAARRRDGRGATPGCSPRRSTTVCTSRTGRRRSSTRSAPSFRAGAVGATLSGSGPTVIVWADDAGAVRRRARAALPRRDRARAAGLAAGRPLKLPWELELGEPFFAPFSKLVAPARLPDGTEAVVKIQRRRRRRERARAGGAPVLGRPRRGAADRPRPGRRARC